MTTEQTNLMQCESIRKEIERITGLHIFLEDFGRKHKIRFGKKTLYKGEPNKCELILAGMYLLAIVIEETKP